MLGYQSRWLGGCRVHIWERSVVGNNLGSLFEKQEEWGEGQKVNSGLKRFRDKAPF